ncbi:MAG: TlpA family protein disulfide reductase [Bacillota bacterium]
MKKIKRLALVVLIILAAVFIIFKPGTVRTAPGRNSKAPDFTLADTGGKQIHLAEICGRNKLTLVNFWSSGCMPCRMEIPYFVEFYQAHRNEGLEIIAVNIGDDAGQVARIKKALHMDFPVPPDTKGVAEIYAIRYIPATFFIDKNGIILDTHVGAMTREMLEERLSRIEAEKGRK